MKKTICIFIFIISLIFCNITYCTEPKNNNKEIPNKTEEKSKPDNNNNNNNNNNSEYQNNNNVQQKDETQQSQLEDDPPLDLSILPTLDIKELQLLLNTYLGKISNLYDELYEAENQETYEKILNKINAKLQEKEEILKIIANYNIDDSIDSFDDAWNEKDSMIESSIKENPNFDTSSKSLNLGLNSYFKNTTLQESKTEETITYLGSQNNYLSNLSIENVEFSSPFKKTTLNYFANVDSTISNLTINATAEDENSIVTIYGNTDLQDGKNKIIICVTSENRKCKNI